MRRPRFTLRAMMIAVALCALAAWAGTLRRRSAEYTAMAANHETKSILYKINKISIMEYPDYFPLDAPRKHRLTSEEEAECARLARLVGYERQLARMYRRAARFPWLPVGPDPAPPS